MTVDNSIAHFFVAHIFQLYAYTINVCILRAESTYDLKILNILNCWNKRIKLWKAFLFFLLMNMWILYIQL